MELINLAEITKIYKYGSFLGREHGLKVLDRVSLSINEGECLGLIGKRGCGKSTLGRILLDIEKYNSGQVIYKGKNIRALNRFEYAEYRKNVQVVFQNGYNSFNPKWKIEKILSEPLINFKCSNIQNRVSELLVSVGLKASDKDKYPHQFSGGELQRINIARSLALSPALIVLDEAVSSLDMIIQSTIIALLKDIQKRQRTSYLFICHDMRLVNLMCSKIHFLDNGVIADTIDRTEKRNTGINPELLKFIDRKNYVPA